MRKFFAVAMGSAVALLGFAGAANASATVDLIWIDVSVTATNGNVICLRPAKRNCPQMGTTLSSVAVTDNITLAVILTAGPNGTLGGGISVDYSAAVPKLSVTGFQAMTTTVPSFYLPLQLGSTSDTGVVIDNINAAAAPILNLGIGLPAGNTAYLGTVSFHKDQLINGTFEIFPGDFGGTGGLLDGNNGPISPIFNSAWLINVPEPGLLLQLASGLLGLAVLDKRRRRAKGNA
jgi:hypothetical protein